MEEKIQEIEQLLQKLRYTGFYRILCVSCKTGRGIQDLKDALYKNSYESLKGRGNISPTWVLFLDYLLRIRDSGISFLEWRKYEQYALKFKLQGSVLVACTNYFSDIGGVLHFKLEMKEGTEFIILDPKWLADLMMCFFSTQARFIRNGMMKTSYYC